MQVGWLEQRLADVRDEPDWLSARELERMAQLRIPKRRDDWRLGRWTAKNATAAYLHLPHDRATLRTIEIHPANSGAPAVFLANQPAPVSISLSHRAGRAICAIAPAGRKLGCDLEFVEPRSEAFLADYFTAREQGLIAQAGDARLRVIALLWSAKESTLKALQEGLRIDPRSIEVSFADCSNISGGSRASFPDFCSSANWQPLRSRYQAHEFHGCWQFANEFVRTVVSGHTSPAPVLLTIPVSR